MRKITVIWILVCMMALSGCDTLTKLVKEMAGEETSTTQTTDTTTDTTTGSDTTTSTTNSTVATNAFQISGTIASLTTSGLTVQGSDLRTQGWLDDLVVYAVKAVKTLVDDCKKKVEIKPDGSFSVDITKGEPWTLAIINTAKQGAEMIQGVLKANEMDSFIPKVADAVTGTDLGNIAIADKVATMTDSSKYSTLVSDLGMTEDEATKWGSVDDLNTRYINPDMDGNGVLDVDENNETVESFQFWVTYDYGKGTDIITDNIRAGVVLPIDATMYFSSVSPELRVKSTYLSAFPSTWSLAWTDNGTFTGTSPHTDTSGSAIDQSSDLAFKRQFTTSEFSAVKKFPGGTYTFTFGTGSGVKILTFTNIKTPADLADTTNLIFPFPIYVTDANDNITSIQYTWMRYDGTKFVEATSADIERIKGTNCAELKWYETFNNDGTYIAGYANMNYNDDYTTSGEIAIADVTKDTGFTGKRNDIQQIDIRFYTQLGMLMNLRIGYSM